MIVLPAAAAFGGAQWAPLAVAPWTQAALAMTGLGLLVLGVGVVLEIRLAVGALAALGLALSAHTLVISVIATARSGWSQWFIGYLPLWMLIGWMEYHLFRLLRNGSGARGREDQGAGGQNPGKGE